MKYLWHLQSYKIMEINVGKIDFHFGVIQTHSHESKGTRLGRILSHLDGPRQRAWSMHCGR